MLLGYESADPEICGCCMRPAIPVGVISAPGAAVATFICTYCNPSIAHKVKAMKSTELHALERKALGDALKSAPVDLVGVILRSLVDNGVNDLGALHAGNYAVVREKVTGGEKFTAAVESLLVTYSQTLRRELVNMRSFQA